MVCRMDRIVHTKEKKKEEINKHTHIQRNKIKRNIYKQMKENEDDDDDDGNDKKSKNPLDDCMLNTCCMENGDELTESKTKCIQNC